MRKKTEAELPYEPPVWLGPISNGEYFRPATRRDLRIKQEILRRADGFARRVGMDRREFLASAYLGKMLKYVGEDRLLWGTEGALLGSPQCQIEAMKAFKMDSGLREMYQYPDLNDALKRKLFGLTAAQLLGVDPDACRYQIDTSQFALHKQALDQELGPRRWALSNRPVIRSLRDFRAWRKVRMAGDRKVG